MAFAWFVEFVIVVADIMTSSAEHRKVRMVSGALIMVAATAATGAYFFDEWSKSVRRSTEPDVSAFVRLSRESPNKFSVFGCAVNNTEVTNRIRFYVNLNDDRVLSGERDGNDVRVFNAIYLPPKGGGRACHKVGVISAKMFSEAMKLWSERGINLCHTAENVFMIENLNNVHKLKTSRVSHIKLIGQKFVEISQTGDRCAPLPAPRGNPEKTLQ